MIIIDENIVVLVLISFTFGGCDNHKPSEPPGADTLFEYLPASHTGINFANSVEEVPGRNVGTYDYMYNGGGVAVADFNNDGLPDLFFSGSDADNSLYINQGGFVFKDVSEHAGIKEPGKWATGVTVVDVNSDGWHDLYISHSGPDYKKNETRNSLYVNQRDNTFREAAKEYGIDDNGLSTHAVFFDMDGDGDLDLWVLNHAVRNWANQTPDWLKVVDQMTSAERKRFTNSLYRNENDGRFTEISEKAGLDYIGFGLGIAVSDFNKDGRPDVFVANDYFIPDRLFINLGNGVFAEQASSKFSHTPHFSMGCDAADFNNDGLMDLAVLDMTPADHYRSKMNMASMDVAEFRFLTEAQGFRPQYMFNSLYRNDGDGVMSDIAHLAGVAKTDWSWAPLLADFDNDGLKDLYITNGVYRDILNNDWRKELMTMLKSEQFSSEAYFQHLKKADSTPVVNPLFRNENGYQFKEMSAEWGVDRLSFSNGVAYADLNLDGHLDLVVNNLGETAFVIRNNGSKRNSGGYLRVSLECESNKMKADGSVITLYQNGQKQMNEYRFNRGYQSHVEPLVHFGLGDSKKVDSLVIRWPNNRVTALYSPEINKVHNLQYDHNTSRPFSPLEDEPLFFDVTDLAINPPAMHSEKSFNDFEKEVLLPHKMSQLGPAICVGDINADGLDDFYLGGSLGEAGKLYIQTAQGYFQYYPVPSFLENRKGEELGAMFFDYDGDGHLDLYVARGGGGELENKPDLLQDLLYHNDGSGNFTLSSYLPEISSSTKALSGVDWDLDGDLDLFVGGRNVPGQYPQAPRSYLLENRNGRFVDVTSKMSSVLQKTGMVTDALWIQSGGSISLLIVGEWMEPQLYIVQNGILEKTPDLQLANASGWWNRIEVGDFNGDGQNEYLLGNLGLNNKFQPSAESPLYCFANDFDDNGTLDIVLSKNYKEQLVPVRGRECSSAQMPVLADEYKTYHDFASASLIDIYGDQKIESAISLKAEYFSSALLMRENNKWELKKLPVSAQIAPIQGAVVSDYNNDGHLDLIVAGNNFVTEVETTPYDSGKGLFLKGRGDGTFEPVYTDKSGIFLPGDVRELLPIKLSSDGIRGVLVAENNGRVRILIRTGE